MFTNLAPSASDHKLSGNTVVHFVVGLAALGILGGIGLVVLGAGAKKPGVLPPEKAPTQQHAAGNSTDQNRAPQLTAQQTHLLEFARADPDYRAWTEVDELTRQLPTDLQAADTLARRLEPIESRWSSPTWSKVIADKIEMARRDPTVTGENEYLKLVVDAVSKLRSEMHERVLQTILMRNLSSLAVSRADLIAFGKQEGMPESWEKSGMLESADWRSWTIASSSIRGNTGSRRIGKGTRVTVACDAGGEVKHATLVVKLPDESDYLIALLKLPKAERDLRQAARVRQILAELPAIVRRFLLVAAPEQVDATFEKVTELAAQTPAQILSGIPEGTSMWRGTLAPGEQRQVEFTMAAGAGLLVSVTQPSVKARLTDIGALKTALAE